MIPPFRISVQLSEEPSISTPITLEQLAVYFYSFAGRIKLDVSTDQFTHSMHYAIKRGQFFEKHFVCFYNSL